MIQKVVLFTPLLRTEDPIWWINGMS